MSKPVIRHAEATDLSEITAIYNHYIETSIATFEENPVDVEELTSRWRAVTDAGYPWLVIGDAGQVDGYAYATRWKPRSAYRFAAESTIYMRPQSARSGLGTMLYRQMQDALRAKGLRSVLAGIALPNDGSISLHERLDFVKAGHLRKVGFKFGRWIDVGYWQRVF